MRRPKPLHPVAAARHLRGWTQAELASLAGVTAVSVSHIETNATSRPHPATRNALASALGFKVADLWPDSERGQSVPHELQRLIDAAAGDNVPRRVRPSRLTAAEVKARGWSTEPSDEYGGASEADVNAAYLRQDPATWTPLAIDGIAESPPRWFREQVRTARRTAPARAPKAGTRARPRARRDGRKRSTRASSSDDPPGLVQPASGYSNHLGARP